MTLDPHADRVIVMDLPYLQKLAILLSDTKPLVVGKKHWVVAIFSAPRFERGKNNEFLTARYAHSARADVRI